jgi:glycosyltransferase involved in cell wall biosynthesis
MRILYIHTYYIQRGGEDIVYENEVKLMEEAGCTVHSVLFNNKKFAAVKFLFFFFNPHSFIRIIRAIRRFRPDVIHVHNWFFAASPSVFIAARWKKIPVVHTIHNLRILCPSSFLFFKNQIFLDCVNKVFPMVAIQKKVYRDSAFNTFWLLAGTRLHYFWRTWQRIDLFICLSNNSARILCDSFLHIPREKIVIKPNFFSMDAGQPLPATVNRRELPPVNRRGDFLYVGRLAPEKGIDLLLEAFGNGRFPLRIIGEGPLREKVERFAAANDHVRYLGFQNKERIIEELRQCNALVFATIGFEQFGMVIIEAFACGIPVIGPDSGSPAELVKNGVNGLHFHMGSPDDLLRKITQWETTSEEVRRTYSANALLTYQQYFTPEINLGQLSNIYKSLLHEKNASA